VKEMPKLVIKDTIDAVDLRKVENSIGLERENYEFFDTKGIINQDALGKKVTVTIEW
jgi:hypothetical protein